MALSSGPVQLLIWPHCQQHSPYCPSVLLWEVILQVPALWAVPESRSSICMAAFVCSTSLSLALHHLSSARHKAQPDTPALGLQLPVTGAKELSTSSHSGCRRGCSAFLPIQILPMLPRGQAGSNHSGPFWNCTRTSVGCHTSGEQFLVTSSQKRGKNSDQRRK